ncbi:MAG: hypothetical protein KBC81_02905 [Candidatus Pacebacteria bacterium]|nr:hypothetical protein [Candidatus Paceibacterota bacterium]
MAEKTSYLKELNTDELIALVFLVDQDKTTDELERLIDTSDFVALWQSSKTRYKKLIQHYPNEEEERFFILATLEAVHGFDPFSINTKTLKESLLPFVQKLALS